MAKAKVNTIKKTKPTHEISFKTIIESPCDGFFVGDKISEIVGKDIAGFDIYKNHLFLRNMEYPIAVFVASQFFGAVLNDSYLDFGVMVTLKVGEVEHEAIFTLTIIPYEIQRFASHVNAKMKIVLSLIHVDERALYEEAAGGKLYILPNVIQEAYAKSNHIDNKLQ